MLRLDDSTTRQLNDDERRTFQNCNLLVGARCICWSAACIGSARITAASEGRLHSSSSCSFSEDVRTPPELTIFPLYVLEASKKARTRSNAETRNTPGASRSHHSCAPPPEHASERPQPLDGLATVARAFIRPSPGGAPTHLSAIFANVHEIPATGTLAVLRSHIGLNGTAEKLSNQPAQGGAMCENGPESPGTEWHDGAARCMRTFERWVVPEMLHLHAHSSNTV